MHRISRLFLVASCLGSLSAIFASDPGDRAFTPLAGGSFGEAVSVGTEGNLVASLPLVLPTPRGGLPMPFAVTWTGSNSAGAAGVGWEVPIPAVTRQRNLSRRKPVHQFDSPVAPFTADRIFLNTGSGPTLMVATDMPAVFQPFGNGYFQLTSVRGGFIGRDAQGRAWTFRTVPALFDSDFFPLMSIVDAGGTNRIDFRYEVFDKFSSDPITPPFNPDEVSMRELVLAEITHSHDGSGICPKYSIALDYIRWPNLNFPVFYPDLIGLDFAAGRPRGRTRILQDIRVQSNSSASCAAAPRTERTYRIKYVPDVLTGQPRLDRVDWFGTGDPATDPQTALPVVAYQYGSPLNKGELRYTAAENIPMPAGPQNSGGGFSMSLTSQGIYGRVRDFQDMNGDGRADFFSLSQDGSHPILSVNRPSSLGNDFSTLVGPVDLPNAPAAPYNLGAPDLSFNLPVAADVENLYQQVIDFNGDGRPDILIATEGRNPAGDRDPNYWEVLVNTPGPSGIASDIVWLPRQINISALRAEIQRFHVLSPIASSDQGSKALPVMRTHQTGAFSNNVTVESAVLTQWKLVDVNGDGFPDFVFDRLAVQAFDDTSCDPTGACKTVLRQDHPPTNRLMVIYHTGPMMAGSGAETQNLWNGPPVELKSDGACGIERLKWLGGGQRRLQCGFLEVNGDGLVDYIRPDGNGFRALRSSGLAEVDDHRLPENPAGPDYDDKRTVLLPGPVDQIADPRNAACSANGNGSYRLEQKTALRDITGDGIADYIYFGTRGALEDGTPLFHPSLTEADRRTAIRWWFMAGTGVGFAAPLAISVPQNMQFGIHVSREQCDGSFSGTTTALLDIDGDGRPELVQFTRAGSVLIAKLDTGGETLGAHSAGQVTAIDNRYGGVLKITYGSAKSARTAPESVPFPQIVVMAKEQTATQGFGSSLAPVRYAYGSPQQVYHPLLGRWVFTGYRTRVELIGEAGPLPGTLKGTANVYESVGADEITGDAAKLMLAGRPKDLTVLAGILPEDPRRMLVNDLGLQAVANRHTGWRTQPLPGTVPPLVPFKEECYATPPVESPGMFGDLVLCRRASSAYVGEQTTWEGDEPFPSSKSVATRVAVNSVDDYARPTLVQVDGDRTRTDDDHCVEIAWASSVNGTPLVLDTPHTVRAFTCGNTSRVLSGVRYSYDGLPEGSVSFGLPSGRVLERHDLNSGALLEQVQMAELERDTFGNVVRITRTRSDGTTANTNIDYDPFGLRPVRTENTATGLAQSLISKATRDVNSLLPLVVTDQNGAAIYNSFDTFGRLKRQSVSLPGDSTRNVLMDADYAGFADNSGARTLTYRIYHAWTNEQQAGNADPATVGVYTEVLDEIGRKMNGLVALGGDYNGQSLVVNYTVYDSLGRPSFVADPFPATDFLHYGTTFTYRADGRPECQIQGLGPQTVPTTDEASNRFASCNTFIYGDNQLAIRTSGPNELAPGKPQSGAFDEIRLSGTGALIEASRSQNDAKLELMQYAYDPLGGVASVTRFSDPQTQIGRAMWQFVNDSFGKLLSMQEPEGVTRNYNYDSWGNLNAINWLDSTGIVSAMRGIKFQYDGLSRLTHSEETQNGHTMGETVRDYFYDRSSGLPQQLDAQFLTGRLAYARTPQRSVFFGYDGLGRLTTLSQSDGEHAPYYAERKTLGPSDEIATLDLLLPDTNHVAERIAYVYDSARRPQSVKFTDQSGPLEVWRALQSDVFGRVVEAQLGNGAVETYNYRPNGRRELLDKTIQTASGARQIVFNGYDAGLLLKGFSETGALDGSPASTTSYQYDARNALSRATVQQGQTIVGDTGYGYDGLGNLRTIFDYAAQRTTAIDTQKFDPDRVCNVRSVAGIVTDAPPSSGVCGYRYDALGNVSAIHDSSAYFVHDGSGRLKSGQENGKKVSAEYGPFGALANLRLVKGGVDRRDHIFGNSSARVEYFDSAGHPLTVGDPGARFQSYIERSISSPAGQVAAIRRSNTGQRVVLYPVGEYQGTRAVLGANDQATETIAYSPFGGVLSDSSSSSSLFWWPQQWNGGHPLSDFGLTMLDQRILDPATGRFLERDPAGGGAGASVGNPYSFAWNNPVKFADQSGAQPDANGDQGGAAAGTVSFVGAASNTIGLAGMLNHAPAQPGGKVDPYIEMGWACNLDHDCISAIESTYGLTDFEKTLRHRYHEGTSNRHVTDWNEVFRDPEYHLILDGISGAVIGYAMFDHVVTIYNRNGQSIVTGGNEASVESSFFQPADLLAGPIVGFGEALLGREAATAIESAVADDALDAMYAFKEPPYAFGQASGFKPGVLGKTSFAGEIEINPGLTPGTRAFTETLRHEACHRCLTPLGKDGLTVFRQNLRRTFYYKSTLLRYAEEAIAETYSKGSLSIGLRYPFANSVANSVTYQINPLRLGIEAGIYGGAVYGSYQLGAWLGGDSGADKP